MGIGDFVNAVPLFHALRPYARQLHLATNPAYHLLVMQPKIFDRLSCEHGPPPLKRYDLMVEIVSHPSKLRSSPVEAGRHIALSTMGQKSLRCYIHEYLQHQLSSAGFGLPKMSPRLTVPDTVLAWVEDELAKHGMGEDSDRLRVGIHPGAGFSPKLWPAERFAELADRLIDRYGASIALFMGPDDGGPLRRMLEAMEYAPNAVISDCNLVQIAAAIKSMDLFISCDSGLMHVAAALDVPLVAVFGPTHPRAWGPFSENAVTVFSRPRECHSCGYTRASRCESRKCLAELSVETVLVYVHRAIACACQRHRSPGARYVTNRQSLGCFMTLDLRHRLAACPEVLAICEDEGPATLDDLADALLGTGPAEAIGRRVLVDELRQAGVLIPAWYARIQHHAGGRHISPTAVRAQVTGTKHILFGIARETDASEVLALISHLPAGWSASVLVSKRHPLMGTILSRHAIPYRMYEDTDDFYAKCEYLWPDAIVWASYANIGHYDPRFLHIFVDHGMASKGHFMAQLTMGTRNLNDFAMVCVPNRTKYERLRGLRYSGRLELTGYLKGDIYRARTAYPREEILSALNLDTSRRTVLFNPTNISGIGTGTLVENYEHVLRAAQAAEVNLVIRPHEEDYVHRRWILERIHRDCRANQVIVLDWESPMWISIADLFIGDASSANMEAVMCAIPTVLLPAAKARSVLGTDNQIADIHQAIMHRALPTVESAEELTKFLLNPQKPPADGELISYFNEYYDGRVHERVFNALDSLMASA
jgi:hypothetical protein